MTMFYAVGLGNIGMIRRMRFPACTGNLFEVHYCKFDLNGRAGTPRFGKGPYES